MQADKKTRSPKGLVRAREKRSILVIGDLVVAILALAGALYLWSLIDQWSLTFWRERVAWWYYLLPFAWLLLLLNLYDPHRVNNLRVTMRGVAAAALIGLVCYAVVYLLAEGNQARLGVGFFLALASIFTLGWRLAYIRIFTAPALMRRVLILGAGTAGETLLEAFHSLNPRPFHLLGFVDDDPGKVGRQIKGLPILADGSGLAELVERESVSDLVIAISGEMHGSTFQAVLDAQEKGVEVSPMALLYEELLGRVPVHHLESEWLIRSFVIEARTSMFYEAAKRLLDLLGGFVGMLLLLLLFPVTALGIALDSGFPVIYKQVRSGKGGRLYQVAKCDVDEKPACTATSITGRSE